MKVLLSIKPQHAEKIFEGTKNFEFRRAIFKNKNIKTVVVYASSPVQKVIGEFEIEEIIKDELKSLWLQTMDKAGIAESFFYEYFVGKKEGYAIKIKNVVKFPIAKCLKKEFNVNPPQSFLYL